jgi:hypothetical protein
MYQSLKESLFKNIKEKNHSVFLCEYFINSPKKKIEKLLLSHLIDTDLI